MFGIGMPELILIAVVALIVSVRKTAGPGQILAGVREFRKATSELKETLQVDKRVLEVKRLQRLSLRRQPDHPV